MVVPTAASPSLGSRSRHGDELMGSLVRAGSEAYGAAAGGRKLSNLRRPPGRSVCITRPQGCLRPCRQLCGNQGFLTRNMPTVSANCAIDVESTNCSGRLLKFKKHKLEVSYPPATPLRQVGGYRAGRGWARSSNAGQYFVIAAPSLQASNPCGGATTSGDTKVTKPRGVRFGGATPNKLRDAPQPPNQTVLANRLPSHPSAWRWEDPDEAWRP